MTERALMHARQEGRSEIGTITVAMVPGPEGLVFSRAIPDFMRRFPDVQLLLRTMTSPEQIDALLKRDINVGFLRGPIESDEIAYDVYSREKVVVLIPQSWPIARKNPVPLAELSTKPHIAISREVAPAVHDVVDTIAKLGGVTFRTHLNTENLMTAMNAVASGLGFCILTEYVRNIVPKGVVTRHLDLEPTPELNLLIAYRKDDVLAHLSEFLKGVRKFAEVIEAEKQRDPDMDDLLAAGPLNKRGL